MSDRMRLTVEEIKKHSRHLRGSIVEELVNGKTYFTEESIQLLKFHGMYQQDDRDLRQQLKKDGKEKAYSMMIRARIPGGVLTSNAYLTFDRLSEQYGNNTLRITTRQTFQIHGILKTDVEQTIRSLHDTMVTTLGGCGDQVRNILLCPAPHEGLFYEQLRTQLELLVDELSAKTAAYHEIWLDGEKVASSQEEEEPLYGQTYLPRKFKLAIAVEQDNCLDVYANDLGIVAHREGDAVSGYTLLVGGGMGRNHTKKDTYPRVATPLCFILPDDLVETVVAIVSIQRDYGNRSDRQHSRFKYLLDERGLPWFSQELQKILGRSLTPARDLTWSQTTDHLGWHKQGENTWFLGLPIQNGRIRDTDSLQLKTALRRVVERFSPEIHLTTSQNMLLCHLREDDKPFIESMLREHGVQLVEDLSLIERYAMACPALPTCGLAITESERVMPTFLTNLSQILIELGLENEEITVRMTGCPNGCARPYVSDIGLVGRAPDKYDVYLGGDFYGTRLNDLYAELVTFSALPFVLRDILLDFKHNRIGNERFGTYCHRISIEELKMRAHSRE